MNYRDIHITRQLSELSNDNAGKGVHIPFLHPVNKPFSPLLYKFLPCGTVEKMLESCDTLRPTISEDFSKQNCRRRSFGFVT